MDGRGWWLSADPFWTVGESLPAAVVTGFDFFHSFVKRESWLHLVSGGSCGK